MFDNSPNSHPIKNLWWDMKIAAQSPSSPSRLEVFCQDKWPRIAASLCAGLVEVRPKRPASLTASTDGSARCRHGRDWFGGIFVHFTNVCVCVTNNSYFYHSKHFSSIVDQKLSSGKKFIKTEGCKTVGCVRIGNKQVSRTWQSKIIWGCNSKCCPAEVRLI